MWKCVVAGLLTCSGYVVPSHSGFDAEQWLACDCLFWNLQQRVLFRIHTGFPFHALCMRGGSLP